MTNTTDTDRSARLHAMADDMWKYRHQNDGHGAEIYALRLIRAYTHEGDAYGHVGTIEDVTEVIDALELMTTGRLSGLAVGAVVDFRGRPGYIAGTIVELDEDFAIVADPVHRPERRRMPVANLAAHRHTHECECA